MVRAQNCNHGCEEKKRGGGGRWRGSLFGVVYVAFVSSACIDTAPVAPDDVDELPDMVDATTAPCEVAASGEGARFQRGEGTLEAPYVICDAGQLSRVRGEPAAYFVIEADIALDASWEPIPCFKGSLDGRGHTITGLDVDHSAFMSEGRYKVAGCVAEEAGPLQPKGGFISEVRGATISDLRFAAPEIDFEYRGELEELVIGGGLFGVVHEARLLELHIEDLDARVSYGFGAVAHGLVHSDVEGVYVYGSSKIRGALGDVGGVFGFIDGGREQGASVVDRVYFVSDSVPSIQVSSQGSEMAEGVEEALTLWFGQRGIEVPDEIGSVGRIGGIAASLDGCVEMSEVLSHHNIKLPEEVRAVGGVFGVVGGDGGLVCRGASSVGVCDACAVEVSMTSPSSESAGREIGGAVGGIGNSRSFRMSSSYVEGELVGADAIGGIVGAFFGADAGLSADNVIVDVRADGAREFGCLVGGVGEGGTPRESISLVEVVDSSSCEQRLTYSRGMSVDRTVEPWAPGRAPRIARIEERLEELGISR